MFYRIYQLKEEADDRLFFNYKRLKKVGITPSLNTYEEVYSGTANGDEDRDVLNNLFLKFNLEHPSDFCGHSMSVSDVIAIRRDGKVRWYFVDSIGFKELVEEDFVGDARRCPVCGKYYTDRPALSRKDNQTEICPCCGTIEALDAAGMPGSEKADILNRIRKARKEGWS